MTSLVANNFGLGDESSPLVRIRSLLPGLARAEQRVAQVVLDDPAVVAHRSITEVAEAAGTSETTVTRFCKAIGVGGYPELRLALAAATARTSALHAQNFDGDINPSDEIEQIVAKVAFADARAVEETADQLSLEALATVVDLLAKANRIDVYGVGASGFVAFDFQQKLHRIGRMAFTWSDPHKALTSAALLKRDDVALGISHTGSTMETIDFLSVARQRGATTVTLTNFPRSAITQLADHVITTAARETTFRSGAMASRIAQLTVLDCVYVALAQRLADSAQAALDSGEVAIRRRRLGSRPDGRRRHLSGA